MLAQHVFKDIYLKDIFIPFVFGGLSFLSDVRKPFGTRAQAALSHVIPFWTFAAVLVTNRT